MYIADLHIHSRFSRATSKELTPEHLDLWARKKGIDILGTGDFTHPAWREELAQKLEPAEDGLYVLKKQYVMRNALSGNPRAARFVISGEISSIYKKNGRVRKVHSLILLPSLEAAEILSKRLEAIGNIHSDGRPILGLDCRDLLAVTLEACPEAIYVPAHIWTPHFSLFGAFSGFDTIEECYEDLTPQIHALETGLSSDPAMNWRLSALDGFQLISNSDAHSPAKLGREANLLDIPLSYQGLYGAIQRGEGLMGTIEFFPEEGKYHFDGHRNCHLCLSPSEARQYGGVCPVCGRKLTTGVLHRIEQLADRQEHFVLPGARPFENLVPLPEVIAASSGISPSSVKVARQYEHILAELGNEFYILRQAPLEDIRRVGGSLTAEGVRHLREGRVEWRPGYDGEYGTMKLFQIWELSDVEGQLSLALEPGCEQPAGGEGKAGQAAASFSSPGKPVKASGKRPAPDGGSVMNVKAVSGGKPTSEGGSGVNVKAVSGGKPAPEGGAVVNAKAVPGGKPALMGGAFISSEAVADGKSVPNISPASSLNPRQKLAAECVSPVTAVIAGPGTGKTHTLVQRLAFLIGERGVKPSSITAVTFTNKAARELKERIRQYLPGRRSLGLMQVGTFHSICYNMLLDAGLRFTLADEGQMEDCAGDVIEELELSCGTRQFLSQVSLKKAGTPASSCDEDPSSLSDEAFTRYNAALASRDLLDFDDLILKTLELLESEGNNQYRKQRFFYLLVDEFQDINPAQYRLIKAWNQGGKELFVIGDPDQAIYGFRGSDSECFEALYRDFSSIETVNLNLNYRSTPQILSACLPLISCNPGGERRLEPTLGNGSPVRLVTTESGLSEAIYIAKEINRMVGGIDMLDAHSQAQRLTDAPRSFSDLCVLYRTNNQARLLEQCLQKEGIPYIVAGREDFLNDPAVQGTVCFFHALTAMASLEGPWQGEEAKNRWQDTLGLLNKLIGGVHNYDDLREQYAKRLKSGRPWNILADWARNVHLEGGRAMESFIRMSYFHKTVGEMMTALAFGQANDIRRSGQEGRPSDAVTLMTFHASKGLEFPVVFLYGIKQGVVPLKINMDAGPQHAEEERRLLYVAMTRAREELVMTCSEEPSSFLSALPEDSFLPIKSHPPGAGLKQMSLFDFIK